MSVSGNACNDIKFVYDNQSEIIRSLLCKKIFSALQKIIRNILYHIVTFNIPSMCYI
jgi:hypothetical protein